MPSLCRTCLHIDAAQGVRCPHCGSSRIVAHAELVAEPLQIAHVDCDAFYASIEKRDDPALRDRPVIVGGGRRGVVTTACYIARISGVRSAMPMFKALALCPDAVVVKPRFEVYAAVSRQIRAMMEALTPAVEPLSLDEAFLDMRGTARLHGHPPARLLQGLVHQIEGELGLTVSVGLSHNKFLAKLASDMDKPQGFTLIGKAETLDLLAPLPVGRIWGVGEKTRAALATEGIHSFADLRRWDQTALLARFGSMGPRLWHLARGEDTRQVTPDAVPKAISNELTFSDDTADADLLDGHIWRLAEKVSARAKAKGLAGRTVTVKLKQADHRLVTRRHSLPEPTQLADRVYRTAKALFDSRTTAGPFRLIGVGLSDLSPADATDWSGDLLDRDAARRAAAERATDRIRARFGHGAIGKGRSLR